MDNRVFVRGFSMAVAVVYIILGFGILFWKNLFQLDGLVKIGFGSILIAYGCFRIYRVVNFDKFHE